MTDNQNASDLLNELYEMVQEAKGVMLHAEKCTINRDEVLDILEAVMTQLPEEIQGAKKIVEARNELIAQGRREAESAIVKARSESDSMIAKAKRDAEEMISAAKAKAASMVQQEAIYQEARRQSKEMLDQANQRIEALKDASNNYMAQSLAETEKAVQQALKDVQSTKSKFEALTQKKKVEEQVVAGTADKVRAFFQDVDL